MSTWNDAIDREFVTELLKIVRDPEQSYDEILQLVLETYGVEKA